MAAHMAEKTALVNSWLPPTILASIKSDEQMAEEEKSLFQIQPSQLGVGAVAQGGDQAREEERVSRVSRARLLSKRAMKHHEVSEQDRKHARDQTASIKGTRKDVEASSSEEEVGRSGLGRKRVKTSPCESTNVQGRGVPQVTIPALPTTVFQEERARVHPAVKLLGESSVSRAEKDVEEDPEPLSLEERQAAKARRKREQNKRRKKEKSSQRNGAL